MPNPEKKPAQPIDTAPDIIAAAEMEATLRNFNLATLRRSALTEEDRETLATIRAACDTFVRKAATGQTLAQSGEKRIDPKRLAKMTAEYCELLEATKTETVGDLVLKTDTPAIESGAIRRHAEQLGESILGQISTFVRHRRAREEQQAKQRAMLAGILEELKAADRVVATVSERLTECVMSYMSGSENEARDRLLAARCREVLHLLFPKEHSMSMILMIEGDAAAKATPRPKPPRPPEWTPSPTMIVGDGKIERPVSRVATLRMDV